MRICPYCKKLMLDITEQSNVWRCWECGKTIVTAEKLVKLYRENKVMPELRTYVKVVGRSAKPYVMCPLCELANGVFKATYYLSEGKAISSKYIQHLKISHDLETDTSEEKVPVNTSGTEFNQMLSQMGIDSRQLNLGGD